MYLIQKNNDLHGHCMKQKTEYTNATAINKIKSYLPV